MAVPSPARAEEDILINDFEAADYGDWKMEGEAFGKGPAKGTLGGQMHVSGFEGRQLVNTFLGGDRPTGKLTSPEFTIERNYIKFLIGGGGHKGKTCMNLLVDGEVVLAVTLAIFDEIARNSEPRSWLTGRPVGIFSTA